ncbi:UspA domain protein [Natrinema pellirubrum DSM 15624]|uniref:HPP family n=1 Tax=Natrinema pellirubrum (strain DSM 15624 / CIP 106293 / JCM 10476 / NCIMB 786 / 157) TaxID=797303 RepID=L0JQL3_NATP1|nr:HPP family protein [Natrinema pellirubrum]AGB33118.1 HPP family [Natrinema pellirubrum DSM 15624]ELY71782.1 UspA domain protein [Natrinema pellirubrum DSM 15624]
MLEGVRARLRALARRLRRLERRELEAVVRWLEQTGNLLHLSVLVFVPLLIAAVTWLANATPVISFLLFPPLASGTFTLFAEPEGKYASPGKFVGGMTIGACCGWLALALTAAVGLGGGISAWGAALGVFCTGVCTWALDLEVPTAFSTALLVLVTGNAQVAYVLGIVISSSFVAAAFVLWRDRFYEQRARYLYRTTSGDDHVLVPMTDCEETVARFAASIAGAHDAGKVVLFDVVETVDDEQPDASADGDPDEPTPAERAATDAGRRLESLAADLQSAYDVPCEVVVAADSDLSSGLVLETARAENCDLIVTPYAEREGGGLSSFITGLFEGEIDTIVFRSNGVRRTRWRSGLVAVRGAGDTARAMLDFAIRVTESGRPISVCTCIDRESRRRAAEGTLADLVDAFAGPFETHVVTAAVEDYLARIAPRYDVCFVGSSTDRSAASRFVSPPTFRKLSDLEADVAIVHRGRRR